MQVGEWCKAHGVEYIGHVVEDNGNHARTGYGTGHFSTSLSSSFSTMVWESWGVPWHIWTKRKGGAPSARSMGPMGGLKG